MIFSSTSYVAVDKNTNKLYYKTATLEEILKLMSKDIDISFKLFRVEQTSEYIEIT